VKDWWKFHNSVRLFIYLYTCLLNSPKAAKRQPNKHIHANKDKTRQLISFKQNYTLLATTPTFRVEKKYVYALHILFLITINIWAGHVVRMREKRNSYRILVGKPGGKRPLGISRRRWVDSMKMDVREIEIGRAHV
jgi:hypothetical protein